MSESPTSVNALRGLAILNDLSVGGGVERILTQQLSSVFCDDSPLVYLFQPLGSPPPFAAQVVSLNVPAPPYSGVLAEAGAVLLTCLKLWYRKRADRVRICVSHKEAPNFANIIAGFSKTIVTVHEAKSSGIKYKGLKRQITRFLIKQLYNRADAVVAVSQGIAQDLIDNFGVKAKQLTVITNPCDVSAVAAAAAVGLLEKATHKGPPTLISVGRLETQKGQWHLIRAFQRVRETLPDARLVIAGVGDHLPYLKRLVEELKLSTSISFTGFLANPHAEMAKADVFVSSSLWEGFPLVLAEAMACGLPVVATDCPTGAREILAPGTSTTTSSSPEFSEFGVLVSPMDGIYHETDVPLTVSEWQLAQACIELLTNTELRDRYRAQGYRRMHDFSLGAYAQSWQDLIARVGLKAR